MAATSGERTYDHSRYGKVKSVTTILSQTLPKDALAPWAAKVAAESMVELARKNATESSVSFTDVGPTKKWISIDELELLVPEAKAAHRKVAQDACDIGTEVHAAIECKLKTGEYPTITRKEVELALSEFDRFCLEHELVPIELEIRVEGEAPYAGRCDIVCMLDNHKYLIDIKTSNAFYEPSMPLQLAAYAHPLKIDHIGIVRLDKRDGSLEWRDYSWCVDFAYEYFLTLVEASLQMEEWNKKVKAHRGLTNKKIRVGRK